MPDTLSELISKQHAAQFATATGTHMHERLRKIIIAPDKTYGDDNLIQKIKQTCGLAEYFTPTARTEVPVAGIINNKFISRRIDRMLINTSTKQIKILDYKTDINNTLNYIKYKKQLQEYRDLLHIIYPDFIISTAILWTHDWRLEQI